MTPLTIGQLMADLLQTCVDAYAEPGVTVQVPAAVFVTHGQPVVVPGCEQLTVNFTQFRSTAPFPLSQVRAPKSIVVPGLDLNVEIWRACWPTMEQNGQNVQLPAEADLTAAALIAAQDTAAVGNYLHTLSVKGGDSEPLMFPSAPQINTSQDVSVGVALPTGPQGSMFGTRIPVSVKLAIP